MRKSELYILDYDFFVEKVAKSGQNNVQNDMRDNNLLQISSFMKLFFNLP